MTNATFSPSDPNAVMELLRDGSQPLSVRSAAWQGATDLAQLDRVIPTDLEKLVNAPNALEANRLLMTYNEEVRRELINCAEMGSPLWQAGLNDPSALNRLEALKRPDVPADVIDGILVDKNADVLLRRLAAARTENGAALAHVLNDETDLPVVRAQAAKSEVLPPEILQSAFITAIQKHDEVLLEAVASNAKLTPQAIVQGLEEDLRNEDSRMSHAMTRQLHSRDVSPEVRDFVQAHPDRVDPQLVGELANDERRAMERDERAKEEAKRHPKPDDEEAEAERTGKSLKQRALETGVGVLEFAAGGMKKAAIGFQALAALDGTGRGVAGAITALQGFLPKKLTPEQDVMQQILKEIKAQNAGRLKAVAPAQVEEHLLVNTFDKPKVETGEGIKH